MDLEAVADQRWRGEVETGVEDAVGGGCFPVAPGVAFLPNFGNVVALSSDDGLILVDTGADFNASAIRQSLRAWSDARVHTIVYTHGHVDHVMGARLYDDEAEEKGWPRPRVIAHEGVVARFERYALTAGYNEITNRRQFNRPRLRWPREFRFPDETYRDATTLEIGELRLELRHERGETDDATVVWVPERGLLCCGDLFIWTSPNAGNPQKVQRYPREWAAALRRMADLGAEVLLPGHGLPIFGAARVHQALSETARYLESIVDDVVAMMNEGASLAEILETVRPPSDLADRPFLQATYDEPEFIVHAIWRRYGGWWDGDPATVKPAPVGRLAAEIVALAGGTDRVLARVAELVELGDDESLRVAGHLMESVWGVARGSTEAQLRERLYAARAARASSTMARGIFRGAARESVPDED